ncbi:exopolysaccharide biosynthesis protein [Pelagovum pacificum]|uniref:Exopolysaccharide biosynthesis protein n=1 Tax=Pelagovum pacificum TaxID=2588711 RepID=A0A5C5GAQ6_9RHOB|nr:exopolysaccharide biosynthesis protein [Pelagovum pacificum]QQA41374.1 exopolysaccharide biosynthesis protein [Pelagovum pacificum]TNY31823.1 exopolysaccharide biosynthesis protein [Pelagovum pacificum]
MAQSSTIQPSDAGPAQVEGILTDLDDLVATKDCVSFGEIVEALGAKSYGPLLLILALLLLLPTGMIPGVGGAIGTIKILIGLQVLRGRNGVWLPQFVRDREISSDHLHSMVEKIRPVARWLRRRMKVRMSWLAEGRTSLTLIAVIMMASGLGMVTLGFIPVIAPFFGLPLVCLALGVVSRDGLMVAAGYVLMLPPPLIAIFWL